MQKDAKKKPDEKPEEKTQEPEEKQDDATPPGAEPPPENNSKTDDNPADDEGKKDEPEKKEEKSTEEPSADNPPVAPEKPATDSSNFELLNAKAQIAAFKSGVRPDVVEDAVCLAMHDAKQKGELTEENVAEALSGVLSRHPEWKAPADSTNNFRVGADGSKETSSSNDEIAKIFGNK